MSEFKYILYNKFNTIEKIIMDWDENIKLGYNETPLGFSSIEVAWLYLHKLRETMPHVSLVIGKTFENNTASFETKYQNKINQV